MEPEMDRSTYSSPVPRSARPAGRRSSRCESRQSRREHRGSTMKFESVIAAFVLFGAMLAVPAVAQENALPPLSYPVMKQLQDNPHALQQFLAERRSLTPAASIAMAPKKPAWTS